MSDVRHDVEQALAEQERKKKAMSSDEYNAALAGTIFGNAIDPLNIGYGNQALGMIDGSGGGAKRAKALRQRLYEEDPATSTLAAGAGMAAIPPVARIPAAAGYFAGDMVANHDKPSKNSDLSRIKKIYGIDGI